MFKENGMLYLLDQNVICASIKPMKLKSIGDIIAAVVYFISDSKLAYGYLKHLQVRKVNAVGPPVPRSFSCLHLAEGVQSICRRASHEPSRHGSKLHSTGQVPNARKAPSCNPGTPQVSKRTQRGLRVWLYVQDCVKLRSYLRH